MDTNINIIFSNSKSGGSESDPTTPGVTPNPNEPDKVEETQKTDNKSLTIAKAMAVRVGKQAINMAVSRVGAVTRSNLRQQQVNAAMKMAGYGIGLTTTLASQNYAAAAMLMVSIGFDITNNIVDYNHNLGIERQTLQINRSMSGINRSR